MATNRARKAVVKAVVKPAVSTVTHVVVQYNKFMDYLNNKCNIQMCDEKNLDETIKKVSQYNDGYSDKKMEDVVILHIEKVVRSTKMSEKLKDIPVEFTT